MQKKLDHPENGDDHRENEDEDSTQEVGCNDYVVFLFFLLM